MYVCAPVSSSQSLWVVNACVYMQRLHKHFEGFIKPLILADALHSLLVCGLSVASVALTPPPEGHTIPLRRLECWPLMQGGAMVVGDLEFKIAGNEGRLWTRGALPKGTSRKCAQLAFRACMA